MGLELKFEWNEQKARTNQQKHGISFREASTVFYDENARLIYDTEHSLEEDRYIILGMSKSLSSLVVVCHVYSDSEDIIQIISARKANAKEQQQYRRFLP